MYLIDTNVISEFRKGTRSNPGVRQFFRQVRSEGQALFLSAITIGELRRGVELIRRRGDEKQALLLEKWLTTVVDEYDQHILAIDIDIAQTWGRLRVPFHENALDKLLAATALVHDLALVTCNQSDFAATGVRLLNPFS